MKKINVRNSEIRFGVQMNVFSTLQIDKQEFSSKKEFLKFLKEELMNSFEEQLSFLVNDYQEDFDRVIPYNKLIEFEIENQETKACIDLLNQYDNDNNNFLEKVVLPTLTKK